MEIDKNVKIKFINLKKSILFIGTNDGVLRLY